MDQNKRSAFTDITNVASDRDSNIKKHCINTVYEMLPVTFELHKNSECSSKTTILMQNKHPMLAMYDASLQTDSMSFTDLENLCDPNKEREMLSFLTDLGLIAATQQCLLCGAWMRQSKQANTWYWICTRRFNGKKCNSAKFSVRRGTFFDHSKLSIQSTLRIIWNFVHHLSEEQCKQFVGISTKTNHTVSEYYGDCRNICNSWIRDPKNQPKLGGFGIIVEMDESYFPSQPKFNRGRRLGTTWSDDEKWVFGLTPRNSLDCILEQVPSNRSQKILLPIINKHCLEGTLFCSDGWKAYNCLADHLELDDVLHYQVNHSKNYVDPNTGAHTQTIEGLWSHVKDFLPNHGMKPCDLGSYLGTFMWVRFCKQRKLDKFMHFLKCAAEIRPSTYVQKLPFAAQQDIDEDFIEI